MINNTQEFFSLLPLIIIGAGIILSLLIEMYSSKSEQILPWFSAILFISTALLSLLLVNTRIVVMQDMFATGGSPNIFNFIFNTAAALVCLLSVDYLRKYGAYYGEYYILMQLSVLGMMIIAGAKDLFVIFMGLEIMSVSFYALAGINRKKIRANEASLKYFLLGAFATGFVVYGIALIYGTAHSTSIDVITSSFTQLTGNYLFLAGMLLFLIGFSFKIAAFPFHMWVPDVYEGAPTTVSGLFSTGGKAAAFSAIIIAFNAVLGGGLYNMFQPYLSVIAVLSMFFGSIVAIAQTNVKRMLAYSSISHAGYMLIGLAAGNSLGVAGITFYLAAYSFMNLGAFGIIALIEGKEDSNLELNSYSGLGSKYPLLSALLAVFMFSLAGLPPFAGFFGKYYIFIAAVKSNLTTLAILGVLSSAISVYFYLRIIVLMYFRDSEETFTVSYTKAGLAAVVVSFLLVIGLGVMPGTMMDLITSFLR